MWFEKYPKNWLSISHKLQSLEKKNLMVSYQDRISMYAKFQPNPCQSGYKQKWKWLNRQERPYTGEADFTYTNSI